MVEPRLIKLNTMMYSVIATPDSSLCNLLSSSTARFMKLRSLTAGDNALAHKNFGVFVCAVLFTKTIKWILYVNR